MHQQKHDALHPSRSVPPQSTKRPTPPDVVPQGADALMGDVAEMFGDEDPPAADGAHRADESGWRQQQRQLLREFLRAVPRAEVAATVVIVRPDGTQRLFTRAELSASVDRLRPRQRQIIRLALEERWSRQRVCAYLAISLKTFMRDQIEALDLLTDP